MAVQQDADLAEALQKLNEAANLINKFRRAHKDNFVADIELSKVTQAIGKIGETVRRHAVK